MAGRPSLAAAAPLRGRDTSDADDDGPELIPSEVDELTHAELLCLYRDAEENIRFAKALQWRTVGATILIFILLSAFAAFGPPAETLIKILTMLAAAVAVLSIYSLVIFQSWQGTEREKIATILSKLSSLARAIYETKSRLAANIERFILFGFMTATIATGLLLTIARLFGWFAA